MCFFQFYLTPFARNNVRWSIRVSGMVPLWLMFRQCISKIAKCANKRRERGKITQANKIFATGNVYVVHSRSQIFGNSFCNPTAVINICCSSNFKDIWSKFYFFANYNSAKLFLKGMYVWDANHMEMMLPLSILLEIRLTLSGNCLLHLNKHTKNFQLRNLWEKDLCWNHHSLNCCFLLLQLLYVLEICRLCLSGFMFRRFMVVFMWLCFGRFIDRYYVEK